MLDVLVDDFDAQDYDEHVLLFFGDGGRESEGAWNRLCSMARRLPAGQDFVIGRTDDVGPSSFTGPSIAHWYDGMPQALYTGSDDLLDFVAEFISAKRRLNFVRRTKKGK